MVRRSGAARPPFRYGLTGACDGAPPMRSPPWASHLAALAIVSRVQPHGLPIGQRTPAFREAPPNPHVTPSFSCPTVLATARLFSPRPRRPLVGNVGACNRLSGEPSFFCWVWPWPVTRSGQSSVLPARHPVRSSWCARSPPNPPSSQGEHHGLGSAAPAGRKN